MGDIKFIGNTVSIEGWTKLTYPDLQIDFNPRRTSSAGHRRALVHDFQDGLTINWAQDYPGGVTIQGKVNTPNELHVTNLKGNHLRCSHHDLHLDNALRRSSTAGARRALVHDYQDGLTINWAQDYPGGVTIRGDVKIPNELHVANLKGNHLRCSHHDLHLDNASRRSSTAGARRALVHDFQDGLTINWAQDYPGGVTIRGDVKMPKSLTLAGVNMSEVLSEMSAKLIELENRVAELEGGIP